MGFAVGVRQMSNKINEELAYLPLVEKMLKNHGNQSLLEHCPLCFHIINFTKDTDGQWRQEMSCCHLRLVIKEGKDYIGKFSYERGAFEGIRYE
jgi:hypothetical protein